MQLANARNPLAAQWLKVLKFWYIAVSYPIGAVHIGMALSSRSSLNFLLWSCSSTEDVDVSHLQLHE